MLKFLVTPVRKFERMFPDQGETYLLFKWCGDGYELYVCKMKNSEYLRILDKPNMQLMTDEKRYDIFERLIKNLLFKKNKQVGGKFFKELPHLLKINRTFFVYKDGSFAHTHK